MSQQRHSRNQGEKEMSYYSYRKGKQDREYACSDYDYSRDMYDKHGSERQRNYARGFDEAREDKQAEEHRQEERRRQERRRAEEDDMQRQEQAYYEEMQMREQQQIEEQQPVMNQPAGYF